MIKKTAIVLAIVMISCSKPEYMDDFDAFSTSIGITSFTAEYISAETRIVCTASFNYGMGQTLNRCGFCWVEGSGIPFVGTQATSQVTARELGGVLPTLVDLNGDGMGDLPGASSGNYVTTTEFSGSFTVVTGRKYSIRPFLVINGTRIVYGNTITVDT
jgi:hypothetical protein